MLHVKNARCVRPRPLQTAGVSNYYILMPVVLFFFIYFIHQLTKRIIEIHLQFLNNMMNSYLISMDYDITLYVYKNVTLGTTTVNVYL